MAERHKDSFKKQIIIQLYIILVLNKNMLFIILLLKKESEYIQ